MKRSTYYSENILGDRGNFGWPAQFDSTDGYVGITQKKADHDGGIDRVLLSPAQVKALVKFMRPAK